MHETQVLSATLVDLLRYRAQEQPSQLAYRFLVEDEAVEYSYALLDQKARALGALLQSMGASGERALLLYPPGPEYVVAFFGCLYAGVVAVPAYPPRQNGNLSRLVAVASDARAAFALTTDEIHNTIERRFADTPGLQTMRLLATDHLDGSLALAWQHPGADASSLAFLQYTSGSTSAPKGVMLTHGNLLHNLGLIHQNFGIADGTKGVLWLPPFHDMGLIGGVLQPLYGGYEMTLMPPVSFIQKPLRWLETISRLGATLGGGPNFAYDLCVQKIAPEVRDTLDLSHWETAFTGAEPIRPETLERFSDCFAPCGFRKEAFYPCYGLAEGTLFVTGGVKQTAPLTLALDGEALEQNKVRPAAAVTEQTRRLVGCGSPERTDQRVHIVHPDTFTVCAEEEVGEIWVGGRSVAQGYWEAPDKTQETFAARLATGEGPFLRTGDLGFLLEGELFVTGRLKDLIIIRGRNHYPQDLEFTVSEAHIAVPAGAGAAFSVEADGEERLVIVSEVERAHRKGNLAEVAAAIRQKIAEQHELQAYGIVLIKPASIPKTSSGKIQRHACRQRFLDGTLDVLHADVLGQGATAGPDAPTKGLQTGFDFGSLDRDGLLALTESERLIALESYLLAKSAQVLNVHPAQIDRSQSLNVLGLDSLMAVELKNEVEETFQTDLSLTTLLDGPSITELATEVLVKIGENAAGAAQQQDATGDTAGTGSTATECAAPSTFPLSYGQRSLWFMQRLAPDSSAYNVSRAVKVPAALNTQALQTALTQLCARHPQLRTRMELQDGEPLQLVQEQPNFHFAVEQAAGWSEEQLQQRLSVEADRPFDLAQGPLWRVLVFSRSAEEHVLLLSMHHIITDFWSLGLFTAELRDLYHAAATGTQAAIRTAGQSYGAYVCQQTEMLNGAKGEQLYRYWQQQLSGQLPVLNLPTDRPRPPVQTFRGASHEFRLGARLTEEVKEFAKAQNTTLYTALLAAYHVLLHRYTGQDDILVGSPAAGRTSAKDAGTLGYFVNPIVLRGRFQGAETFAAFTEAMRRTVLGALDHQEYPFSLLVEKLHPQRDPSVSPLFQAFFVLQKSHLLDRDGLTAFALNEAGAQLGGDLPLESMRLAQTHVQYDLILTLAEVEGELSASFDYNADMFDPSTVARMSGHFTTLLHGLISAPHRPLAHAPLLTAAEERHLLGDWHARRADYGEPVCAHELFERTAEELPHKTALELGDIKLTYAELNERANRLAHHLRKAGVTQESLVAVSMERSVEMVVAMFGILKAGGAYLPLDPAYPGERLSFMLEDSGAKILLTQAHLAEQLPKHSVRQILLDADWAQIAVESAANPAPAAGPHSLAYVIYTSGSTGKPKGVLLEHAGLFNLVHVLHDAFQIDGSTRVLQFASFSFDASVAEVFTVLSAGGTLVLADKNDLLPGPALLKLLNDKQVHNVTLPPSVLAMLSGDDLPHLRTVISAGEACTKEIVERWSTSGRRFVNGYGPTENTVCTTHALLSTGSAVHIGRPNPNVEVYILDSHGQPVPLGVPGELYIGGAMLARGYLNRPELTAEKFVPHLFPSDGGAKLYRSGDLVRWRPDGTIEYLGRLDHQVKVRGFRIELDEIEAQLIRQDGVESSVVIAREDQPGQKRLVAYVTTQEQAALTVPDLRQALKASLPDYMVPSAFVLLTAFPLTPNGKIDRKALPAPDGERAVESAYVAPGSELEQQVTAIWQAVLGLDKIGVHDNFFDLGGHSLLMVKVHERLQQEMKREFSVVEMFKYPTVSALVKFMQQDAAAKPSIQEIRDQASKQREALNKRKQLLKDRRK
ncbi:amino acid adenylation domain-containing protein [Tumebacillus sp. BK434]|uniref:non-ribosomal peptide synthetase n=1 Tax=Tumebacillus sp. BK434 TaxID=2512169 RepID=UPI0010E48F0B|nr:non-ribosomal peptide synthetase [Tumebacillus sp. BK434]TCP54485.1 amino acid adenylation domain-containing protein [Tumebacillus sp. BK434]